MARRKRSSRVLDKAERRAAALKSIGSNLDLGNGLTLDRFTLMIEETRTKLTLYNTTLSAIDKAYNDVEAAEKGLNELTELMLIGVAGKYGKNSNEYEMAGGIRKVDRKRPVRSKELTPTSNSVPA